MKAGKKKQWTLRQRKAFSGILFISPWILGAIVYLIFPIIYSLMISFSKIKNVASFQLDWVGIANFKKAFVEDISFVPMLLQSMQSILINLPLIMILSLFIAILVNKKIKGKGFFRSVFFFPVLLGSGFILAQLLGQNVNENATELARGILLPQELLIYLGPTVSGVVTGFFNIMTMVLWKSGVQILIFLAGLQGIPSSIYESANVDGATEWEKFWKLTLPMMAPTILLNLVFTIVDSFTDVTNPIVDYILGNAFMKSQFEYAAAIGWIYFTFVLVLIGIIFAVMKRFVDNVKNR